MTPEIYVLIAAAFWVLFLVAIARFESRLLLNEALFSLIACAVWPISLPLFASILTAELLRDCSNVVLWERPEQEEHRA